MVFSSSGRIYYVSESVTSLLGYLPNELENTTIYDITYQDDQSPLYNVLLNPAITKDQRNIKQGIVFFFLSKKKIPCITCIQYRNVVTICICRGENILFLSY